MKLLNSHRFMSQKGAAVVEFAIVVPLLLVICFGIIEFSVLLYDKAMLTNASREGARAGIVYLPARAATATTAEKTAEQVAIRAIVRKAVEDYCATHLISFGGSGLDILDPSYNDHDGNGYDSGDSLTVTVNYAFEFLVFSRLVSMFGGGFGDGLNLQAVTVMRLE